MPTLPRDCRDLESLLREVSLVCFKEERTMPPKKRRQKQLESILEKAQESKKSRITNEGASTSAESEVQSG